MKNSPTPQSKALPPSLAQDQRCREEDKQKNTQAWWYPASIKDDKSEAENLYF